MIAQLFGFSHRLFKPPKQVAISISFSILWLHNLGPEALASLGLVTFMGKSDHRGPRTYARLARCGRRALQSRCGHSGLPFLQPCFGGDLGYVFVAAAAEIDDEELLGI